MPGLAASPSLRRVVANLAAVPSEDLELILADLSADQRSRVESLLEAYRTGAPEPERAAISRRRFSDLGLSPWIVERLEFPRDPSVLSAPTFVATPRAVEALQACAADIWPDVERPPLLGGPARSTFADRVGGRSSS